ncbi:MAG TPA: hypothetical protein DCW29_12835, partial [Janthinobacterium sp.]|nr:hypothetical protein [Janthinobacterium sp.]
MNRIYRSIWSIKTGTFVAVSELVKSAGKRSLPGSTGAGAGADGGFALKTLALSMLLAFGAPALALPTGAVVTAGKAGVVAGAGQMTVTQGSQNVALNWNSFNIGQGEAVTFVQPNANAVALNRVLGFDPSSILGNLTANGKVFLVNPNGILFGKGASVNVGGLAASTLGISDADFMAGKYRFTNAGGGVVLNQGSINAPGGYVALLGASVGNEGTISARLGTVALAAGKAITLDVAGDGLLNVAVNQGALRALVQNGGLIQAAGGQVLLTTQSAGDLLKTVVNNTGVIEARSIDTRNGAIRLLGDMQSGTVNADGRLDAGAPDGGAGGFVETSAAHVKIADGLRVNTAAARGLAGTWLVDPTDFTVAASGGDMTGAQLSANLGGGNVSIVSGTGASGTAGNVNVNDSVSWSANTLTLSAQNNINVNAAMHGSGTASLALQYGQGAVAAGNASTFTALAPVDLPSGAHLSSKQGSDGTVVNYTVINSLGAQGSVSGTDLQGMSGGLGGAYALGSNIDASATSAWNGGAGFAPVGDGAVNFTGAFDGLGHVITGLNINLPSSTSSVGLFGVATASAKISKVQLVGGSITGGYNNTGALVGLNYGSVSASSSTATVHGVNQVGGLVGYNSDGVISTSYSGGAVSGASYVGGLVGYNVGANAISDTYATGAVSGTYGVGGLVGFNYGAIGKSYASGAVSGSSNTGGLVGTNDVGHGTVSASFWDTATTGKATSPGGGLGLGTANMKTLANFDSATSANGSVNPAWDMGATWALYDGHSYPLLQAFLTPLTVTANNASKTYDGAAFSGGNGVGYSSVANGTLLGTPVYGGTAQGAVSAGSYSIAPSGLYSSSQQGYLISYANGTLTVDPAALTVLTVSGTVAANKVYDGSLTAFLNSGVLVGVAGGDVGHISLLQSGLFASKNVGNNIAVTATDSLSGTAAGNYTLTQPTGLTANITAATISAVGGITAASKTYDGGVGATLNTGGATFAGMIVGDTLTVGGASGAFADKNAGVGKTVGVSGISLSGADAGNYVLGSTVAGATADIATKALSIVGMTAVGRDYDGGTSAALSGGALSGLVGSETLALTGLGGAFADKDAALGKAVTVTGAALGDAGSGATAGLAANYTVANPTGLTATIGRKALSVSGMTAAGKVYDGGAVASLSGGALSGLVGSETLSLTGQSAVFSNKNVGTGKTVTVSGTTLGNAGSGASAGLAANYSVVDPTGLTADITAKALTVTGMTAGAKVYDGGVGASLTGGALSGLVGTETLTLSGQSGSFADKNAGLGKAVTVAGAVLGDAGSGASAGLA